MHSSITLALDGAGLRLGINAGKVKFSIDTGKIVCILLTEGGGIENFEGIQLLTRPPCWQDCTVCIPSFQSPGPGFRGARHRTFQIHPGERDTRAVRHPRTTRHTATGCRDARLGTDPVAISRRS